MRGLSGPDTVNARRRVPHGLYCLRCTEGSLMSTFRTRCLKCGAILPGGFCTVCGTDNEKPFRQKVFSRLSWMRQYPRFALWAILALIGGVIAIVDENVDFFEK